MKWKLSLFLLLLFFSNIVFSATCSSTWLSVEYLYWWTQNSPVSVPLVTQNNTPGTLGIINQPGTQIVFGSGSNHSDFNFGGISGGRISVGKWVTNTIGIEASGFELSKTKDTFTASSLGGTIPVTNIPFFDTQENRENVLVDRHPNIATVSDTFQPWGIEINTLYHSCNILRVPFVFITGLRYVNITENLTLNDAVYEIPTFPNSVINVQDNFSTKNNFYAFQIGAHTQTNYSKAFLNFSALLALGINFEKLNINGEINENNNRILQPIGLFAEPTNIGTFRHTQWALLPELKATAGYHFNQWCSVFLAYNFFYINNVIRPGDQIDRNINKSQNLSLGGTGVLNGVASPTHQFHNTSLWLQGLSAGIKFNL